MGRGGSFREPDGEGLSEDHRPTIFEKSNSVRYNTANLPQNLDPSEQTEEIKLNFEKPVEDSKNSDISNNLYSYLRSLKLY